VFLVWRPNGLFSRSRRLPSEPLTGTFLAAGKALRVPRPFLAALALLAIALPFVAPSAYLLQTLTNAWLNGMLALSLTLVAGTVGQICRLAADRRVCLGVAVVASRLVASRDDSLRRLDYRRARYLAGLSGVPFARALCVIATLGIGEVVSLVILNWDSLTRGPLGIGGIAPLSLLGIRPNRYKAMAFAFGGLAAAISGGISAHLYSYINNTTFDSQVSILALTMVILGGLGNVLGGIVGAVALIGLPEIFRWAADYRMLIYGVVLLLLVRFRPQGLLGTV
jgi:branched-chain amino acid transport system permease protein